MFRRCHLFIAFLFILSFLSNIYTDEPKYSHRLIVEFQTPSLSAWSYENGIPWRAPQTHSGSVRPMSISTQAQVHLQRIESEQTVFLQSMKQALPNAVLSQYVNEYGDFIDQSYKFSFNGMTVDPGPSGDEAIEVLKSLPRVKGIYRDYAHQPTLYAGNPLIGSPTAWNRPEIGGQVNAGRGVKIASMDGGIHKDAPMFDGTGFEYPPDYPKGGLGYQGNNNGKIIVSRAYYRPFDPPIESSRVPWPGPEDTSHGVHTSGIMAGNPVVAPYYNLRQDICGVAPAAWVMSYKIFYQSVNDDTGVYDAEAICALEDIIQDAPDVLNNSWGDYAFSSGGEFDPVDRAIVNTARSGVFVSFSAGNEGPGLSTTDHATDEYISVASSTTATMIALSGFTIQAPGEVPEWLNKIPVIGASFGPQQEIGGAFQYPIVFSGSIDPNNVNGCSSWEGTPFAEKAALIQRGDCTFVEKIVNAQNAGAEFVIIYNNNDSDIFTMGGEGDEVQIPSIMISKAAGEAIVQLCEQYGDRVVMDLIVSMNEIDRLPDRIANDSSRGPSAGMRLKPDIAAPGVEILSQGYSNETENPHLGFGVASGTSMAAPFVTGSAAILRQMHPDWPNAWIKSALMSTSKFIGVYTHEDIPAQPLDMGAGRLQLDRAIDPGAVFSPPSLSFGLLDRLEAKTIEATITSVTTVTQTYTLSTLFTGDGFDQTAPMPGLSFDPPQIVLEPGQTASFTVRFDSSQISEAGDRQGFLLLNSENYQAHLPAWGRVKPASNAPILLIDADLSGDGELTDYRDFYTASLDELGLTHDVWNVFDHYDSESTLPLDEALNAYKTIVLFTGDNDYLTFLPIDVQKLAAFMANDGKLLIMGNHFLDLFEYDEIYPSVLFEYVLGVIPLQTGFTTEEGSDVFVNYPIIPSESAARIFHGVILNPIPAGDGADDNLPITELTKCRDTSQSVPLLRYVSPNSDEYGYVAFTNGQYPTLENPGVSFLGRSISAGFGLETIDNRDGYTSRTELLRRFMLWLNHQSSAEIEITERAEDIRSIVFKANYESESPGGEAIGYRWNFGDGSSFTSYTSDYETYRAIHEYAKDGRYTVQVEITDTYGVKTISSLGIDVNNGQTDVNEWSLY